jgi:hypothetical protein
MVYAADFAGLFDLDPLTLIGIKTQQPVPPPHDFSYLGGPNMPTVNLTEKEIKKLKAPDPVGSKN